MKGEKSHSIVKEAFTVKEGLSEKLAFIPKTRKTTVDPACLPRADIHLVFGSYRESQWDWEEHRAGDKVLMGRARIKDLWLHLAFNRKPLVYVKCQSSLIRFP